MQTVLISGGTGLVGKTLTRLLVNKGYSVIILTRNATKGDNEQVTYVEWDPAKKIIDTSAIRVADHIIHLAGANIGDKRWTEERKKLILSSRVDGAQLLIDTLASTPNKVQTFITASAIGYYGESNDTHAFTESDRPGKGFLASTCVQWEQAALEAEKLNKRVVIIRTGIVLSDEGGMYSEMLKPIRFGLTPVPGNGKQLISWIHIKDLAQIYLFAIENKYLQGIYNAVSDQPVKFEYLLKKMAKRKSFFSMKWNIPSFILKTALGEVSTELLKSVNVSNRKLHDAGYQFIFPTIDPALYNLAGKK